MERAVLIVDDQRDILKLLRSTLESLKQKELKIFEAPSGEEALLESTRHRIDMLVTDYKLPGMTGVELMHKVRARHPEVKVLIITGMTDGKARSEILNAGAFAVFDKPIPLADFMDAVERGLGFVQTIFPPERDASQISDTRRMRLSDLLANFRQDVNADAVFLINERGLIQARTGNLYDSSMEVSLISTLMSIHSASLKISKFNHQEMIQSFHIFQGGDHDLLFIPVNPLYALLVAGKGLAAEDRVLESVNSLLALRVEAEKALKSMGATGELNAQKLPKSPAQAKAEEEAKEKEKEPDISSVAPSPELEAILKGASAKKDEMKNLDDFWNQAAETHGKKPANPNVITMEEARKMGLFPDEKQ